MSDQSSMYGEVKEQRQKTKDMTLKGKISYFWYYYKIHALITVCILAMAGSFIYQYVTNKDYAFYAVLINADTNRVEDRQWCDEFAEYAGIDTEKFDTYVDTSFIYSSTNISQYSVSSMEKLLVMIQTGLIDVITADTEAFENYAQNEVFLNLETVLPKEVFEKYKDNLYYTDAASFDDGDDDTYLSADERPNPNTYVIDHHDPSTMEQPIPVGIFLPAGNKILETGCYEYLTYGEVSYQGYPSEPIIGIPVNCTHIDTVLQFLTFLEE